MARNWAPVTNGGLGTLVDAYNQSADRSRGIAKEKADSQREGQQWAFERTKNYQKPKTNSYGHVTGYEDNQDTYSRNKPILEKLKPEYFRDPPAAMQAQEKQAPTELQSQPLKNEDYTQGPDQELSPTGRPMGKTYDDASRDPQSTDPKPLLRDPKMAQQEAQLAHAAIQGEADRKNQGAIEEKRLEGGGKAIVGKGTAAVEYDPNDPGVSMGKNDQGVDQRLVNATKTVQQFDKGANVIGGADASETNMIKGAQRQGGEAVVDPSLAQYNPDPYMMGRITDLATTPTPRASDQMVSVSSLPPALLEGTGLEGFKGQIPASLLKDILSGKTKLDVERLKGENKANSVEKLEAGILGPVADDIRTGKSSLGMALEDFEIMAGRPPNKREEGVLSRVSAAREAEMRAKMGVQNKAQTPPPGYRFTPDGATLEEIPGGPAAAKTKTAEEKKQKSQDMAKRTSTIVSEDIARAMKIINKPRATGTPAPALALIPGTDAYNLNVLLDTVKANTSFDKLQAMRDASPTGGALGQVSDRENELLQSAAGKLSVGMKREDLIYNLKRIDRLYGEIVHGPGGGGAPAGGANLEAQAASAIRAVEASGANASEKRTAIQKIRGEYEKRAGKPLTLKKQGAKGE